MHSHGKSSLSHTMQDPATYGLRVDPLKEENLEEGEVLCDVCKGLGYYNSSHFGIIICKKCTGLGKLDWIERIVGKKNPEHIFGMSGSTGYFGTSGMIGQTGYSGAAGPSLNLPHIHTPPPVAGSLEYNVLNGKMYIHDGSEWGELVSAIPTEAKKNNSNTLMGRIKKFAKELGF